MNSFDWPVHLLLFPLYLMMYKKDFCVQKANVLFTFCKKAFLTWSKIYAINESFSNSRHYWMKTKGRIYFKNNVWFIIFSLYLSRFLYNLLIKIHHHNIETVFHKCSKWGQLCRLLRQWIWIITLCQSISFDRFYELEFSTIINKVSQSCGYLRVKRPYWYVTRNSNTH